MGGNEIHREGGIEEESDKSQSGVSRAQEMERDDGERVRRRRRRRETSNSQGQKFTVVNSESNVRASIIVRGGEKDRVVG